MNGYRLCRTRRKFVAFGCGLAAVLLAGEPTPRAHGYTPESPEVRQGVARAMKFLETGGSDDRVGGQALVGLAFLKYGAPKDHAKVTEAVERVQQAVGKDMDPTAVRADIYSTGLAAIFLLELDPLRYTSEIQCLIDSLELRQKDHGGWGYPERETGDTSMTQYGVLSAWEAMQKGFRVDKKMIEDMAEWLLRTQDPTGGFSYQGKVSPNFTPVPQDTVRLSLTAAGLGSLYICADLLGAGPDIRRQDPDLPPGLREVEEKKPAEQKPARTRLDRRLLQAAMVRGQGWMGKNYRIDPPQWTHYYMYALERYMSFRELAEREATGRAPEKSPRWYNDGVVYLLKTQAGDGRWEGRAGPYADTAFGVLFLLRSQQKSIEKARAFGDGTLVGGRGLPKETARAEVRQGQVVARPLLGPAEELLALLDDRDNPEFDEAIEQLAELPPEAVEALAGSQAAKLQGLAADRTPEARLAAVRVMGKSSSLDHVPTLIYALTDPDLRVMRAARDALRRVGRKPGGFGLVDEPSDPNRRAAIEKWKAWYRAVRPDAEFDL